MIPQILQKIQISENSLKKSEFSRDNHYCTMFDSKGLIYLIDLDRGNKVYKLAGHHGQVLQTQFDSNSEILISIGEDRRLIKWTNYRHGYYEIIHHFSEKINYFKITQKNKEVILVGEGGKIYRLYLDNEFNYQSIEVIADIQQQVSCMLVTNDDKNIIVGTKKGQCIQVDKITKQKIILDIFKEKKQILDLSLHPNQCVLAVAYQDQIIAFFDLRSKQVQFSFQVDNQKLNQIEFSQDQKYFFIGSTNFSITIRDLQTGKNYQILQINNQNLENFNLSYSGTYMVSSTSQGNCVIWQLKQAQENEFTIKQFSEQQKKDIDKSSLQNSEKTQQKIEKIQQNINRLLETVDLFNRVLQRNTDQLDQIENHLI